MRTVDRFMKYVEKEVTKSGIKFLPVKKTYVSVEGNVRVSGYFDSGDMELAVAIKLPEIEWLQVLVHEYSHFRQFKANCKAWKQTTVNGEDVCDAIFLWVSYQNRISRKLLKGHTIRTINLELDCEKRTVRNIRKFSLPLDIPTYIQKANSYLYFYNYAMLRRRWWKPNKSPYRNEKVWSEFPTSFMKRYHGLPKKYVELYDSFC